jgi:SAM-dependent methyltransferase
MISGTSGAQPPSAWVKRWAGAIAPGARALDFAAGAGRNVGVLEASGATVVAADRDRAALSSIADTALRVLADLEAQPWPFAPGSFDVVLCCNFLHRPRLDLLFALVAPGGLIVYETFGQGNARYGRPSNPAFLLRPGELFAAAVRNGFVVLGYEHGYQADPKPAIVQRLCAVRPPFEAERYPLVG